MVGCVTEVPRSDRYDRYYVVRPDPEIGHFTDRVLIAQDEIWTRKDAELAHAQWLVDFHLREWETARANELSWKQRRQHERQQLLEARKELRRVQALDNESFKRVA